MPQVKIRETTVGGKSKFKIILPLGYANLGDVYDAVHNNVPTPHAFECLDGLSLKRGESQIPLRGIMIEEGKGYLGMPDSDPRDAWGEHQLTRCDTVIDPAHSEHE